MKSLHFFSILLLFFIFSGCDELLTKDVDVPITFNVTNHCVVVGDLDPKALNTFGSEGIYDVLSHADVADVIGTPDKIKKIEITDIKYEFRNFTGNVDAKIDGEIITRSMKWDEINETNIISRFQINTVNVANSTLLKEQFTLNGDYKKTSRILSEDKIFRYSSEGTTSHNPAIFDIVLIVTATVTVEARIDWRGNYN